VEALEQAHLSYTSAVSARSSQSKPSEGVGKLQESKLKSPTKIVNSPTVTSSHFEIEKPKGKSQYAKREKII